MVLGDNLRFKAIVGFLQGANKKAIVGFLKGANASDRAVFQVFVKENNRYFKVVNQIVKSKNYASLDADLSRWGGKKVQLVLKVLASKTSKQDWAVWVAPRLSK